VDCHVALQSRHETKPPTTHAAAVRELGGVAAHVLVEARAACKRLVADETREWTVTGVHGQMLFEVAGMYERHITDRTSIRPLTCLALHTDTCFYNIMKKVR